MDESSRSRKRGRPAKTPVRLESAPASVNRDTVTRQRTLRDRPSDTSNIEARNGGRPRKKTTVNITEHEEADDENESIRTLPRRGRPRRSKDGDGDGDGTPAASKDAASSQPLANQQRSLRRKRTSSPQGAEGESHLRRKRRGRPPSTSQIPDEKSNPRPVDRAEQEKEQPAKRKRKRGESVDRGRPTQTQAAPSPARSTSPESDDARPYRYIGKKKLHVSQKVIGSKWSSLEDPAVAKIETFLHQVSRPVLLHVGNPKHYGAADETLNISAAGLHKRAARRPFPSAAVLQRREDELDYERTQTAIEIRQSQLDPLQHSVELLRREKERAEKELKREYKILGRLTANARAEATERRDQMRKMHVLVPEKVFESTTEEITDVRPLEKTAGAIFGGMKDEEMMGLAGQINNHMMSMRGNLQQIDGVLPGISRSDALLRVALQPVFDQHQLDSIMFGSAK